jgi:hypothetical protein
VTFSGRTVKWQGVPVRRCALGRITVKAKTRIKVFAPGSGCDLRGPHRGVFRRDGKGPGGVMGIGCIPAILTSRRRMTLYCALQRLRYQTWTHPKPAGTPCRCCAIPGSPAPGVHVLGSRRPIDGARAVQAVQQREGVRAQGPPQLSSIRSFVTRAREEAFLSSSAALEV